MMAHYKRSLLISFALMLALVLSQCGLRSDPRPSILLIAVEGLAFDLLPCEQEGFRTFCEEGIRFTHAFTPSVLSQAALASIFTGRYPLEHGVRHNGTPGLSPIHHTIMESAVNRSYRTAFISGGPPIFRKSGLAQGVEYFDDNIDIRFKKYYRPAAENFALLEQWLKKEVAQQAFLAAIYLPDLQFPQVSTQTDLGELREGGVASQLRELGESLLTLQNQLRAIQRWDNTTVILVGLNGSANIQRATEHPGVNLFAENTQVGLLIKPVKRGREEHESAKIDENISLVDLGITIFDLLDESMPEPRTPGLSTVSLRPILENQDPGWSDHRLILVESAYNQWRRPADGRHERKVENIKESSDGIRWAIRQKQFLYLHQRPALVFNTLTDRSEATPISLQDRLWQFTGKETLQFVSKQKLKHAKPPSSAEIVRLNLANKFWSTSQHRNNAAADLERLAQKNKSDEQLRGWWARWNVENAQWSKLKELGKKFNHPMWRFVAESNLGEVTSLGPMDCYRLFRSRKKRPLPRPRPHDCSDPMLTTLVDWINGRGGESSAYYQESFLRQYYQWLLDDRIAQLNHANYLLWDVPTSIPSGPTLVDLFLSLREQSAQQQTVRARFSGKDY